MPGRSSELMPGLFPSILVCLLLHEGYLSGTYFLSLEIKLLHYLILLLLWVRGCPYLSLVSLITSTEYLFRKVMSSAKSCYPCYLTFYLQAVSQPVYILLVPAMFSEERFFDTHLVSNHLCVRQFTATDQACQELFCIMWPFLIHTLGGPCPFASIIYVQSLIR